jgi:hypothetical protein
MKVSPNLPPFLLYTLPFQSSDIGSHGMTVPFDYFPVGIRLIKPYNVAHFLN